MQKLDTPIETEFRERSIAAWEGKTFRAGLFSFQGVFRLSIWRKDGGLAPISWEELQAVKSSCGFGEFEAVEIYPRDSQVVNTANARHLYLVEEPLHFAMRVKRPEKQDGYSGGLNA